MSVKLLLICAVAAVATSAMGQTAPAPATVPSRFAFEELVTLTPMETIGTTPNGLRTRIPIMGGTFAGPGLSGRVLPGGADWQLHRADGSTIIDADYMIETDDHVQIHVRNTGVSYTNKDGLHYVWTVPTFEAPMGTYGWLNDSTFVGTITSAGDKEHPAVRITIYRIG